MNVKKSRIGALALIVAAATIALSCGSAPPKKQEWPDSKREDWSHKDDPCMEKSGEPRQCTSNDDCCKGFQCSVDPGRSHVLRYCLEG